MPKIFESAQDHIAMRCIYSIMVRFGFNQYCLIVIIDMFINNLLFKRKGWIQLGSKNRFFSTNYNNQTIYALSTGLNSAISIVRVSGHHAYQVLSLLSANNNLPTSKKDELLSKFKIVPKTMTLRKIFGQNVGLIDQCLIVYFQAEHSYTGEDMFEFHLHGSKAIVSAIFKQLQNLNFRIAARGEFTRRSVLNNRLNLQQAEAINDLVNSELQFQRQVAVHNLLGKNKTYLDNLRRDLITILAQIQAYIEFQQEEIGSKVLQKALHKITILNQKIQQVIESSQQLQNAKDGVKISIVGRPNVGKSTLMNQLMQKDVSIVSSKAGTTRDLIESELDLEGFRVKFVDTAGIRHSQCEIQQQGIKRTNKSIEQSEIVVIVFDINSSILNEQKNQLVIKPHQDEQKLLSVRNKIVIVNKCDTLTHEYIQKDIVIDGGDKIYQIDCAISLKMREDVGKVKRILMDRVKQKFNLRSKDSSVVYFTRKRYLQGLQKCQHLLIECKNEKYADLMSQKVKLAVAQVQEMIGRVDSQEVLDSIFSNFCIGK